ncbi:hypothetical protein BDF20DRAFT_835509 [Mycotypha africana]|uniref:uncharacterized protein n=1 Tax=Mycotypha africana TaxID=64632 RepID=UPI002300992F|nr:uncharacterized protein BDF20DRAFT_835509 [Mycotypha africana]KAI8979497.1 hypothetical protein BDF20DRAFT_835509 [Mycotypha africana]
MRQQFNKNGGFKKHKPTPGSTLPAAMQEELNEQEKDDRKFAKRFTVKIANRKELRKQKRQEKGKRNASYHQRKRPFEDNRNQNNDRNKRQKKEATTTTTAAAAATTQSNKQSDTHNKKQKKELIKKNSKKEKSSAEAMNRLSKTNPGLYQLLKSDNLLENSTHSGQDVVDDEDFANDDREIAYFEKKLGLNKKKTKKLGKDFEDDGLLDVLGNIAGDDAEGESAVDDEEYLRNKRQKALEKQNASKMEKQAETAVDDIFEGLESGDDDEDIEMSSESENEDSKTTSEDEESNMEEASEEEEISETDEEAVLIDEDEVDSDEAAINEELDDISDEDNIAKENEEKSVDSAETTKKQLLAKYVPPHLRKAASGKSETQLRLQKQLQGQLNRLSESNVESILLEIEKCYGSYPRHDVTSTLTDIILTSISQKTNLLDSFVITYATIVASLYRLIGIEFAAHFVQTLIESFEREYSSWKESNDSGNINEEEGPSGARQSRNLLTLTLELYNFEVLSCVIIYDLVRLFISNLDESSVELLLKTIRTAGPQMRNDDPASLKQIIEEIQKETAKRDPKNISTRHKFMLETINNIKNNKIRQGQVAGGQGDKEMVQKMKKFLNGLAKKRSVRSTEALRVSLDDIHNVETKGKWWLVGASWKDNLVGTESKYTSSSKVPEDLKKDRSLQEALLKLARKQGMNTDIRRTIFVTIMSAEDYLDAFEKLMKLGLSEVQQREICRVMLQCTGNEKTFNPYYMLVSRRLCEVDHSFKITFQYCLWDFLRECGETEVGGLERTTAENHVDDDNAKQIRLSRLANLAKFYAALIAEGALTLAVLKSVNFMSVRRNGRIFLEILFAHLFLQLHASGAQAVANVFGKILDSRTLAQGCNFFIAESVVNAKHTGLNENELEKVLWGCKIAREILSSSSR